MGLFDRVFAGGAEGAGNAVAGGYGNAINYMNPYYQGGTADYNRYRGEVGDKGDMLARYGNPADYQWRQGALSPYEAYEEMMAPYMMSPQAQYQIDQMQKAADRGASASGMLGSGTYFDKLQRNQQDIVAQDQDNWLKNMMGVSDQQLRQIMNFQGQEKDYLDRMYGLSNMGLNAANMMGQYAIGQGQGNAMAELGRGQGWQEAIGQGASLASSFF